MVMLSILFKEEKRKTRLLVCWVRMIFMLICVIKMSMDYLLCCHVNIQYHTTGIKGRRGGVNDGCDRYAGVDFPECVMAKMEQYKYDALEKLVVEALRRMWAACGRSSSLSWMRSVHVSVLRRFNMRRRILIKDSMYALQRMKYGGEGIIREEKGRGAALACCSCNNNNIFC